MQYYKPIPSGTWQGRIDEQDGERGLRWHQKVQTIDLNSEDGLHDETPDRKAVGFLGFACDEGVRRNFGRPGARNGPEYLRKACSNLAWHFGDLRLLDYGNVVCDKHDLETAQEQLSQGVQQILDLGVTPLVLGGGHEIAYGHYNGISRSQTDKTIGIVNIDAHFDLRKPMSGPSSGTPFYQIQEDLKKEGKNLKYLCIGIQESANTMTLFDRAKGEDVKYFLASEVQDWSPEVLNDQIQAFSTKVDFIYLTICLDAFDISIAPGVSAPSINGLGVKHGNSVIKSVMETGKLVSMDIAELNPDHDIDGRTAKLGSMLVFEFVRELSSIE